MPEHKASTVLSEDPRVAQKFPVFYGTGNFITVFTGAVH
jgi:hypothetical protein